MKHSDDEFDKSLESLNEQISRDDLSYDEKQTLIDQLYESTDDQYQQCCISNLYERLEVEFGGNE